MRISDEARLSVVFLGHGSPSGEPGAFEACATGFLVSDKSEEGWDVYLVTAAHCVHEGLSEPFQVRFNTAESAVVSIVSEPRWVLHPDPGVDVAIMPLSVPAGAACKTVKRSKLLTPDRLQVGDIGPGDQTYTVGLFSFVRTKARNIPLVHLGHIAAFPDQHDRIEVRDWLGRADEFREVEAYVVQCSALPGASGSPVFVRKPIVAADELHTHDPDGRVIQGARRPPMAYGAMFLLGLWHGSWEINPARLVNRSSVRDPAGYGIVVPAAKILEVLDLPALRSSS